MPDLALLLGIALVVACSTPQPDGPRLGTPVEPPREGAEVDVGPLVQSPAVASLDVLIPADGDIPSALESARQKAKRDGLKVVDSLPPVPSQPIITIQLKNVTDEDWPRHLQGYVAVKIDPEELADVARATAFVHLEARASAARGWDLLRTVTMEARDLAAMQHGWIYDPYRAELHDPRTFEASIPGPQLRDVRVFTRMMEVVSKGGLDHVRTIGLWRLGLPELYVPDIAPADLDRAGELVRATAQTLLQDGSVARRGVIEVDMSKLPPDWPRNTSGTGRFTWRARWMRGPIHNNAMLIVLSAPGAQGNDPTALTAALREYGGEDSRGR